MWAIKTTMHIGQEKGIYGWLASENTSRFSWAACRHKKLVQREVKKLLYFRVLEGTLIPSV